MSEPQASRTTALLARKGHAAPIGAASDAALGPSLVLVPETLPEIDTPSKAGKAPAASLMPLDFLAGRPPEQTPGQTPGQTPERADKRGQAPHRPDPAEVAIVPAAKPGAEPGAKPEAKPAPIRTDVPKFSAKPEVPRPDPALRPALGIGAAARPAVRSEPRRFPALVAGLALVLGAAGYGYQSGWFESQPSEPPQAPAAAALAPAELPAEAPSVMESDPAAPVDPAPGADPATAEPAPGTDPSSGTDQPSVDVVRIEPDGAAVIAGRAAPGVELILLDNGVPIGTVTADTYGEWVFIPSSPLPSGAHDFGLVIKEIRGGVSVPAAGHAPAEPDAAPEATTPEAATPGVPRKNEPGTAAGAAVTVPIPPRKPDIGAKHAAGASSPAFVIQLASVKSRTDAQREWRALRKRFPEILSQMSLSFDEAKLAGGTTVVRLRTGAFPKQADAAAFCARLAAKHQRCLVVRTAVKRAVKR